MDIIAALIVLSVVGAGLFSAITSSSKDLSSTPLSQATSDETEARNDLSYGVSSSSVHATQIGMQVLEDGGNAVDAAIATAYALGVAAPDTCGIGGGGCMLVYDPATDQYTFFNYFAEAPRYSERTLIGVPGFVSGMEKAWETHGTKPLPELLQPSIDLAQEGFEIGDFYTRTYNYSAAVAQAHLSFAPSNNPLRGGELLRQPELANTLRLIQDEGSKAFYSGAIAEEISLATSITKDDLGAYETIVDTPVKGEAFGYEMVSAPPPFSGITLVQMLESFDILGTPSPPDDEASFLRDLHRITNVTHANRVMYLGDPRYLDTDFSQFASREYASQLIGVESLPAYQDDMEHETTTHIAVIDKNGMVVSMTNTLSSFFGSQVMVRGFFLNDSLYLFSSSGPNVYAEGKRPRTFIAPTIIRNDSGYVMSIGTPGGNRIVRILAPILLESVVFDANLQKVVDRNRAIFTEDNVLTLESNAKREDAFQTDAPYSYYLVPKHNDAFFGCVQAVGRSPEHGMFGASDTRRDGIVELR